MSKSATKPNVAVDFDLLRSVGGRNFRDLGGHPSSDGRRVRTTMVYRSAHLANLNGSDPHPLSTIRLRTLVTLQSRLEVRHLGPPLSHFMAGVRWEHIPIGDPWFREDGFHKIEAQPGHEHLVILTEFREDWGMFFKLLADREAYPLLFHCSAGRDRTGVAAAMLLELLGVSREHIIRDFLLSNETFPKMLLGAKQLAPIFAMIDENDGIENFMRERLGLAPTDLAEIRQHLIEPSAD